MNQLHCPKPWHLALDQLSRNTQAILKSYWSNDSPMQKGVFLLVAWRSKAATSNHFLLILDSCKVEAFCGKAGIEICERSKKKSENENPILCLIGKILTLGFATFFFSRGIPMKKKVLRFLRKKSLSEKKKLISKVQLVFWKPNEQRKALIGKLEVGQSKVKKSCAQNGSGRTFLVASVVLLKFSSSEPKLNLYA